MTDNVAQTGPKVLVFLCVMVIGWIIARVLRGVVQKLLNKVGFDRWVGDTPVGEGLKRSGWGASMLVAKITYWAILLVTLQMAFGVFGANPVSDLLASVVAWLPKAAVAIILVVVASAIAKVVKDLVIAATGQLSYGRLLANIAQFFILAVGIIAALNQIGVATTVTTPILVTVLATIGAILAIGVGGGLIKPMQERWERMLSRAEKDAGVGPAYDRGREDALRGSGERETTPVERTTLQ
ncbi:mechanosensitive ion channel family protein [Actinocorallia longicatena]|uniref:mechanosensitive ion channel family protein n=1 Tax=Actinocorallia longicatena TaxID=111803 RepID=UPI0031D692DC